MKLLDTTLKGIPLVIEEGSETEYKRRTLYTNLNTYKEKKTIALLVQG